MGGFITHGWVAALAVIPASAPAANRTGTVSSPSSPHITRLYWRPSRRRMEILKVSPKRHKRPQVDKVVDKVSSIRPAFLSLSLSLTRSFAMSWHAEYGKTRTTFVPFPFQNARTPSSA